MAANLLYLTIYNPTLRPTGLVAPDDEDAEEQAHILFYTSKERAVSRDRMLRQVGLAKALISFSEVFNADEPCNNVHSQTKRLIMVSPEPDFWIHAGIELAKTPRPAVEKKGKGKEKETGKTAAGEPPVLFDHHEHSVHDLALQADIVRGYDKFKLRHGSFSSILSTLGKEALELQLERFFTIWAWSWNLEDGLEFGESLGPPLHPQQSQLVQSMDEFSSKLPEEVIAIAVSPPYTVPSTRYTSMGFSSVLPLFLQTLVPPPAEITPTAPISFDESTLKGAKAPIPDIPAPPISPTRRSDEDGKSFLGMNVDMPKWNWPGYLTFGKGKKPPDSLLAVTPMNDDKRPQLVLDTPGLERTADFEVDRSALEDAMVEERLPIPEEKPEEVAEAAEPEPISTPEPEPPTPVEFSSTTVYLATADQPHNTTRRKVFYLERDRVVVALLCLNESQEPAASTFAEDALSLATEISVTLTLDSRSTETLPSASNILQQKDRYALSSSSLTIRSPDFQSQSGHLYQARALLQQSEPNISEVFSRGQSPQHWHIARQGLGTEEGFTQEEVFMEVFRKEATLTDVDNALAGVIRKTAIAPNTA
ncbi:hypothetical protein HMN09_00676100 [Mycena chlorophos]|uniref:CCZ1/INTU/HSP4 first Longin domain-containing protein n=1 Tax=Mycena chlorophos TaxID=658473 RepID=A0A8H6W9P5_MYCCL|nr:hypothetical protein HMN09_00676100 [Mycena chlorophos]